MLFATEPTTSLPDCLNVRSCNLQGWAETSAANVACQGCWPFPEVSEIPLHAGAHKTSDESMVHLLSRASSLNEAASSMAQAQSLSRHSSATPASLLSDTFQTSGHQLASVHSQASLMRTSTDPHRHASVSDGAAGPTNGSTIHQHLQAIQPSTVEPNKVPFRARRGSDTFASSTPARPLHEGFDQDSTSDAPSYHAQGTAGQATGFLSKPRVSSGAPSVPIHAASQKLPAELGALSFNANSFSDSPVGPSVVATPRGSFVSPGGQLEVAPSSSGIDRGASPGAMRRASTVSGRLHLAPCVFSSAFRMKLWGGMRSMMRVFQSVLDGCSALREQ